MIINVSQLLKEPIGATRSYRLEGAECAPFTGSVELVRTDGGVLARGSVVTVSEEICSRCLVRFNQSLNLDFQEEYLSHPEESSFAIDEYRQIDLSEALRQYALLAEPMKPLCSENCAGLCSSCGANLNVGRCSCKSEIDPRLAVLASLAFDEG